MTKLKKILVSSNCQTSGLALALKAMLPGMAVHTAPMGAPGTPAFALVEEEVRDADFWVVSTTNKAALDIAPHAQKIVVPRLVFDAFHPDIAYVQDASGRNAKGVSGSDYHSSIALWCYTNKVPLEQCISLFRADIFQELGYLDRWSPAVSALKASFTKTSLSFDEFFRPLIGQPPFMHTNNHPRLSAISQMARMIARDISGNPDVMSWPIETVIQDTLAPGASWPIYPDVGRIYGLQGSYIWKIGSATFYSSLEAYLSATYEQYDTSEMREWVSPRLATGRHDAVLSGALQ